MWRKARMTIYAAHACEPRCICLLHHEAKELHDAEDNSLVCMRTCLLARPHACYLHILHLVLLQWLQGCWRAPVPTSLYFVYFCQWKIFVPCVHIGQCTHAYVFPEEAVIVSQASSKQVAWQLAFPNWVTIGLRKELVHQLIIAQI